MSENSRPEPASGRILTPGFSGGAIGAGLFIGSGGAFQTGGPASVLIGFMLVGEFASVSASIARNY